VRRRTAVAGAEGVAVVAARLSARAPAWSDAGLAGPAEASRLRGRRRSGSLGRWRRRGRRSCAARCRARRGGARRRPGGDQRLRLAAAYDRLARARLHVPRWRPAVLPLFFGPDHVVSVGADRLERNEALVERAGAGHFVRAVGLTGGLVLVKGGAPRQHPQGAGADHRPSGDLRRGYFPVDHRGARREGCDCQTPQLGSRCMERRIADRISGRSSVTDRRAAAFKSSNGCAKAATARIMRREAQRAEQQAKRQESEL